MADPLNPPPRLDLLPLTAIVWHRKWWLLLFVIAGAGLAYAFSASVTPLYESNVVMYPSSSNSREKMLEDLSFGHEVQAERLMQLLNSTTLLDSLESRFQLATHYGIDKSAVDWYDQLYRMARKRITFHKNKYVSVTISVVDADPESCAEMANEAARLVNVINANIVKEAARASLEIVEKEYMRRQNMVRFLGDSISAIERSTINANQSELAAEIDLHRRRSAGLRDSLDRIRRDYGIFDFGGQITILNQHLTDARANLLEQQGILDVLGKRGNVPDSTIARHEGRLAGARNRVESFEREIARLNGVNKRYSSLSDQLRNESELLLSAELSMQELRFAPDPKLESHRFERMEDDFRWDQLQTQELHTKYQRALSNYLEPVPVAIVVSTGRISHQKIYPHTLTNIAFGAIGCLFAGVLLFTVIDRRRAGAAM